MIDELDFVINAVDFLFNELDLVINDIDFVIYAFESHMQNRCASLGFDNRLALSMGAIEHAEMDCDISSRLSG